MLSPEDLAYAEERGMDASQVEAQLNRFKTGFPYLKIKSAARQGGPKYATSPIPLSFRCFIARLMILRGHFS